MIPSRRKFFKRIGAVIAGVAAAAYCPAVLGELLETTQSLSVKEILANALKQVKFEGGTPEQSRDVMRKLIQKMEWQPPLMIDDCMNVAIFRGPDGRMKAGTNG